MAYTTIDNPELFFQTVLYTGNGSDDRDITLPGDEDMQPDLVWLKSRDTNNYNHFWTDSVRGVTKYIKSDGTSAENTLSGSVKAFNSDGFRVGTEADVNNNTTTYVAWCWKENTTAGFDIVTYTGASGDQTFAHSLGVAPEWYLVKERGNVNSWVVNHIGLANQTNAYLLLNTNDAAGTDSWFNSTAPSSSVVHANDGDSPTNRNGGTYVMYLWRSVKGFSKFGSYIGNGNADGTFVYTGFKPAWVMIKNLGSGHDWWVLDNKRDINNPTNARIVANEANAEDSAANSNDFLSNGFKCRASNTADVNGSGDTMIYMAFAESPFVNSNGVPTNAR